MSLNNLKIGGVLIAAFSTMVLVVAILAAVVIFSLNSIENAVKWNNHTYVVLDDAEHMLAAMVDQETGVRGYLVSGDTSFLEPWHAGQATFDEYWQKLKDLTSDNPTQQDRLDRIKALARTWQTDIAGKEIELMSDPATVEDARQLEASGAGKQSMDGLRGLIDDFQKMERDLLGVRGETLNNASATGFWSMLIGSALVAVLAIIAGLLVLRRIGRPIVELNQVMRELSDGNNEIEVPSTNRGDEIGQMANAVQRFKDAAIEKLRLEEEAEANRKAGEESRRLSDEERARHAADRDKAAAELETATTALGSGLAKLAQGDLTSQIDMAFSNELDSLRVAFNDTVEKFKEIVSRLKETSRGVKTATSEMLSGANDLSERTTRQAATIEETAAAMESLSTTVTDNAERAEQATGKANTASQIAEQSGEVMNRATTAMERISQSSSKISNIIGMIDDIAFQTNLLALNASVEAARAGEAGKGFAVVAVEVRRLAQSAAEASSEVKSLIDQSAEEVSEGSDLVADAAGKLENMLGAVRENSQLMRKIAEGSRDQALSIGEVSTAVRQMDEMTQHNAALVEQTNVAIEQTEGEATKLDEIVEIFVVEDRLVSNKAGAPSSAPAYASVGNNALQQEWKEIPSSQ